MRRHVARELLHAAGVEVPGRVGIREAVRHERLAPGGLLGVVIATETNLERRDKPGRPFLLGRNELVIGLQQWLQHIPDFALEEGADVTVCGGTVSKITRLPLVW